MAALFLSFFAAQGSPPFWLRLHSSHNSEGQQGNCLCMPAFSFCEVLLYAAHRHLKPLKSLARVQCASTAVLPSAHSWVLAKHTAKHPHIIPLLCGRTQKKNLSWSGRTLKCPVYHCSNVSGHISRNEIVASFISANYLMSGHQLAIILPPGSQNTKFHCRKNYSKHIISNTSDWKWSHIYTLKNMICVQLHYCRFFLLSFCDNQALPGEFVGLCLTHKR